MNSPLYTAYGFMLDANINVRPCGMNTLVHLDRKPPSKSQRKCSIDIAIKRGYDTLAFYRDDKLVSSVALW